MGPAIASTDLSQALGRALLTPLLPQEARGLGLHSHNPA